MRVSVLGLLALAAATSLPAMAQFIWTPEVQDSGTGNIGGGTTQRPTIASVVFNQQIFIAYTSSDSCNADGSCAIKIKKTSSQLSNGGFSFTNVGVLSVPGIGQVYSKVNPAMGIQNNVVYITWTDPNGNNKMAISTDMSTWSSPLSISTGPTIESVGLSFNPLSSTSQVTTSYATASPGYPVICGIVPNLSNFPASSVGCYTSTTNGTQMLYNPGIIWQGNSFAYMFLTWHGSSHCLSSWYGNGNDPWTYWNPYNNGSTQLCAGEQTSSAPDAFVYNGTMYVAFRSNDSSAAFHLIDFIQSQSGPLYWSTVATGGQHMDGSPDMLPLTTLSGGALYSSQLVNFYVRGNYLYSVAGH